MQKNPYDAPAAMAQAGDATQWVACPKCGGTSAALMKYTWWGGVLGPKLFTHVKCPACRTTFNGKTGKSNTTKIVIYQLVVGVVAFAIAFSFF